jgi:DnaJ homolog subfamily A member 2
LSNNIDIPATADRDTIREAYKRAAFANHPDRAVDEADRKERTARFQKINEANYILSNDERVLIPTLL